MKTKTICVRKFEKLVSPPDAGTDMFWIKFFPDKLLGSMNFKRCNCYEQSLYLAIFLRVRREKENCGMLVYPNGNPISIDELISDMNPPRRSRTDIWTKALKGLLDKELVYMADITTRQLPTPLHADLKTQPEPHKELEKTDPTEESRVEEKRVEKTIDPFSYRVQIAKQLALEHQTTCPDQKLEWVEKSFITGLNQNIPSETIRKVMTENKGKKGSAVIDIIKAEGYDCNDCKGKGQKKTSEDSQCLYCKGTGKKYHDSPDAKMACENCAGTGRIPNYVKCFSCKGQGHITGAAIRAGQK